MGRATADEAYLAMRRAAQTAAPAYEGQARPEPATAAPDPAAVRAALAAMLRQAQECGEMSPHSSLRQHARYAFHSRVEIRRAIDDDSAALLGSLHDMSCGGLSVWAPLAANPGDRLAVRIWPRSQPPVWVEITVQHCNEGRGGVLIGGAFDEPLSPAAPPPPRRETDAPRREPEPTKFTADRSAPALAPPQEDAAEGADAEIVAALLDLLQEAREAGDVDRWNGKRRNVRYSFSPKLELRKDETAPDQVVPATLYNVSRCGMALWSRQAFLPGTVIQVRLWPPNQPSAWVPVNVEHCERGLRGFLIGASFPVELPHELDEAIEAASAPEPPAAEPQRGSTLIWFAAALVAALGLASLLR